ncbi:hypothetical protein K502DRAFT_365769 [Neoconidiobolus thromboides FSU 785]|nr:hypothetical protein K502DRAFT_365769 [Neoconidiobolus thromboides FSU 785]
MQSMTSTTSIKKKKVTKACDNCREKKKRCDAGIPACSLCTKKDLPCTYWYHQNKDRIKNNSFSFRYYQPSYNLNMQYNNNNIPHNTTNSLIQLDNIITATNKDKNLMKRKSKNDNAFQSEISVARLTILFNLMHITDSSMLKRGVIFQLSSGNRFYYQGYSPMGCLTAEITFYDKFKETKNKSLISPKSNSNTKLMLGIIEYNPLEESLVLSLLCQSYQDKAIKVYFQRFHYSFPVLSPKKFLNYVKQFSANTITTKINQQFSFLLNVVLLISCAHSDFPKRLYLYLEHTILTMVNQYYNVASEFTTCAFLLLRAPPAMTVKLMKWTNYGEIGIRLSLLIGALMKTPKFIAYQEPSMMRIAGICFITDRIFGYVLNRQPMLTKYQADSYIFSTELKEFDNFIKYRKYYEKENNDDLYLLKWQMEYHQLFYKIHQLNQQSNNILIDDNLIIKIKEIESQLTQLMLLTPQKANIKYNKLCNPMFQLICNQPELYNLFYELPTKQNKLSCMIQLWYYTAIVNLYSKSLDFSYFIQLISNNDNDINNNDNNINNKNKNNELKLRSTSLSLLAANSILNILLIMENDYSRYFVAFKWYCLCNCSMVFARFLIVWNYLKPKQKIDKIIKLDMSYFQMQHNVIWKVENIAVGLGILMFFMEKACDRWFIVRENLNMLISYLENNDICYEI